MIEHNTHSFFSRLKLVGLKTKNKFHISSSKLDTIEILTWFIQHVRMLFYFQSLKSGAVLDAKL